MGKHTPGPWALRDTHIGILCKDVESQCFGMLMADIAHVDPFDLPEWKANARLISAAPELLEALKKYQAFNRLKNDRDVELFDLGERALKKATGGEG